MEVLNCHSSDQMLDGIVLAVQTLNLHCFKSEILLGKLHEWNYGITVENGNDRHILTENNCTGTCVPCVRWHWHWQRAFNLIVVLSGHTRSHWVFFCVLCSAQLSSILSKLRFHEIVILILQMLHLHLQLYLNFSTESHCICRLNERTR